MKKIAKEEMPEVMPGGGRSSKIRIALINLQVGEGLRLEPGEAKAPKALYNLIARIKKKYGFRYKYTQNAVDKGWLFKRVK